MRRDEVDAGPGATSLIIEEVAGSRKPGGEFSHGGFASPEIPRDIAKLVVPFGPAGRKAADPVATRSAVPGFDNELDRRKYGILVDGLEKAALLVKSVDFAR